MDIDPITGLPKELGVWDNITKESQEISVYTIKKKFGKVYTVIEGINDKNIDIKEITKKLKNKFACGGTSKEKMIELQGDHIGKIKDTLVDLGFPEDAIEQNMKGPRKRR
ncbi:MAG: stress response translation initiation inhibitor YciH [Candidatus Woesearchaeota archaeon]